MDIEEQLRVALRPESPPPDFTAGVMARIATRARARRSRWQLGMALAASLLVAAVGLTLLQQQRDEQRRHAAQQLAIALEITSSQLNEVQRLLNHAPATENGI